MDLLTKRSFKVWYYSVSHSQLLIRSPRSYEEEPKVNIDIIFEGVTYMDISPWLGEISIRVEEIEGEIYKKIWIQTKEHTYLIRAANYRIETSETDIFDSPLDTF
jgi:hypothetical protein